MHSIDDVIPHIYHEKQEPGSMLCAQHALNSLLQGSYFTPPDLSAIAQTLDEQEAGYDDDSLGQSSMNMDDTGFFSVQVLERALQVWGLTLVRWRSERMRPYQNHPHTQLAFILNLHQHWYTLRRFGAASPNPTLEADSGMAHWFNLNSSLEAPEWVSKTYLGMVLQQAETEGYSVFAVVQEDSAAPLALPRAAADHIAATIPEPTSYSGARPSSARAASAQAVPRASAPAGFEDEDMELQAALQASLMSQGLGFPTTPAPVVPRAPASSSREPFSGRQGQLANSAVIPPHHFTEDFDEDADISGNDAAPDPVAASLARNRAFLEQMRREQEAALRESYEEEVARFGPAALRRGRGAHGDDSDDGELRRAIAESEAIARRAGLRGPDDELDDEPPVVPPLPAAAVHDALRVYDDEDAELQAALRASLESMPEGFVIPPPPSPPPASRSLPPASVPAPPPIQQRRSFQSESDDTTETETESEAEPPQAEQLSMEEIRRRRLARFGG
ncbi:Josephin-domain-containing protein [Wolfiporia cocos MD-104 SS10]|uniref:ubiquitinyl hydrolase 1 n=1 Tax=Wolfiporia cocos (strain MD-104) TaxID=742152 RepID=A0A2H3JMH2_WOLCO|nr:Josephin-domain-containing protein [Wolfiporia cocos MD-104 SS10]